MVPLLSLGTLAIYSEKASNWRPFISWVGSQK